MNDIKVLPSNLIDQIAAGEVIERPASAVKELVENSIDAGATQIDIKIDNGGKSLIYVSDNGCGMNKDNLQLSFRRHATSKLHTSEELMKLTTLGFRGEALPSIASVSKIQAKSNTDKNGNGYEIKIFGGKTENIIPTACAGGTAISINNLFFNTPARKKFLKSTNTEFRNVTNIIRRYMLSNPEIGFSFQSNDKIIYNVKSSNLIDRIVNIFGKSMHSSLIPINFKKNQYSVKGFVGNLSIVKKRPGAQYLYINGRFVQDRLVKSGIHSAYHSLLSRGEYPFYVININIPTENVDFNVHPAKLEVRFQDEWRVYHVAKTAVATELQDVLNVSPTFDKQFENQTNYNKPFQPANSLQKSNVVIQPAPIQKTNGNNQFENDHFDRAKKNLDSMFSNNTNELFHSPGAIWQILKRYIITEIKEGLLLVDQHVAHERILFEEALNAINGNGLPSQTLLFPQTVSFQPDDFNKLIDLTIYLEKIGFKIREFGENTIIVEGVPPNVEWGKESNIIQEIIDQFIETKNNDSSFIQYLAASYACKAAIKSGDSLNNEEMVSLINKLFSTENPYYCPHGRPIIIKLTEEELDKRFERI